MEGGMMQGFDITRLRKMVNVSADFTVQAREASERDRDYYDEHQWTEAERKVLQGRKQPIITINRIKRKVDAMVGLEQRMRVDPKAYPRQPGDEDAANAATEAMVFVDDATRFDAKRSLVFENVIVEGYGAVEIVVEEKRGRNEIEINRLRWEELFFDPHSREKDFSDASYIGTQRWMTIDSAVSFLSGMWEGSEEDLQDILKTSLSNTSGGDTYEDRPFAESGLSWGNQKQRRVRVVQMYYLHNDVWYLAYFCGGGVIVNQESPYKNEDGKPCCAIEAFTAYIDRENRRYGVVRSMISQQDEINKRRSKLLHQLNSRQTVGVKGAVSSVADMKRQLASPDGHVEINQESFEYASQAGMRPFDVLPQGDQIAGQFSLLQESKSEIDMFGPNPSLIGQTEGGASGRAIMAQQQAGMAELAPLYDGLKDWTIRVYRAMWARIKQFWTDERWVRILDSEGQMKWTGFNQVVAIDPFTRQPMMQNQPAMMDVDIIIEDVPDHVTLQQEQFEQLAQMASNGIPIPPELLIKASSVKDKADVLQMMKEQQQADQAARMQAMQAQMQMDGMKAQASAQKDSASAQKTLAEVDETRADTEKTRVETLRLISGY